MAYSAPFTANVNDVFTSAEWNTYVRDNLNYLHGDAGAITLNNALNVTGNVKSIGGTFQGNGAAPGMWMDETSAKGAYFLVNSSVVQIQRRATNFGAFEANPFQMNLGAPSNSFVMDVSGRIAMGIGTPQGALHVVGQTAAGAQQGGELLLEAAAVTSLQTLTAAGTVARGAIFLILDRNNTGGALLATFSGAIGLGGNIAYINADTVQISLTAGGAITAQRTSGTSGSHDITIKVLML